MPDVVERACPVCGVSKPLRFFKRWRGPKRVLHADCNACGERPLSAMTHAERLRAVANGKVNVSMATIERLQQRDLMVRRVRIAGVQRAVHSGTRKRQWEMALGTRLRSERDWARRNLANLPSDCVGWAEFFQKYITVITAMLALFVAKYNRVGTPTMPTVEQAHPMQYTDLGTMRTLRDLYRKCVPIRGRRFFRDPWFLTWQDYVVPKELLVAEDAFMRRKKGARNEQK